MSLSSSMQLTMATPSVNFNAVSNDSASLTERSSRTLNRSITTSIVCFFFSSNGGASSSSITSPSIRARIYPWFRRSLSTLKCSPLRSWTTGASNIQRFSGSNVNTESTICVMVCASSDVP